MSISPMNEPAEHRLARRRARRWKRRARIAGPFLGLPLLFGTLALSVDLITYTPTPEPAKPPYRATPPAQKANSDAHLPTLSTVPSTAAPVVAPPAPTAAFGLDLAPDTHDAAPPPPYALR